MESETNKHKVKDMSVGLTMIWHLVGGKPLSEQIL